MDKDSQLIYEAYKKKKPTLPHPKEPLSTGIIDDYRGRGYTDHYDPLQAAGLKDSPECSSCGSTNTEYVGLIKRGFYGEKHIASICRCNDCGHEVEF